MRAVPGQLRSGTWLRTPATSVTDQWQLARFGIGRTGLPTPLLQATSNCALKA